MANEYAVNQIDLKSVADAIRSKSGITRDLIFPSDFVEEIESLSAGGDASEFLDELNAVNGNISDSMETAVAATQTLTDNQYTLIEQIAEALSEKSAGSEAVIGTVSVKPSSNATSISFTGLSAEPKMFSICPTGNITLGSTRYVTGVMYDGTTTRGTYGYRQSSSATSYYSASYFTWTYSNGTLTVTTSSSTNGGNFTSSVTYQLTYVA